LFLGGLSALSRRGLPGRDYDERNMLSVHQARRCKTTGTGKMPALPGRHPVTPSLRHGATADACGRNPIAAKLVTLGLSGQPDATFMGAGYVLPAPVLFRFPVANRDGSCAPRTGKGASPEEGWHARA